MLSDLFIGLETLGGSRFAAITETPQGLLIQSTSLGLLWLVVAAGAFLGGAILIDLRRRPRGRRHAGEAAAVLCLCLLIVAGFVYGDTRLELVDAADRITVERRGLLGPLRIEREAVALADLREIGIGTTTVKAATRNGTPVGPDRTGYYLRLLTVDRREVRGTPVTTRGSEAVAEAAGRLLARMNAHRLDTPVRSNLHRFGYAPD